MKRKHFTSLSYAIRSSQCSECHKAMYIHNVIYIAVIHDACMLYYFYIFLIRKVGFCYRHSHTNGKLMVMLLQTFVKLVMEYIPQSNSLYELYRHVVMTAYILDNLSSDIKLLIYNFTTSHHKKLSSGNINKYTITKQLSSKLMRYFHRN